jgi:hypothetical protein
MVIGVRHCSHLQYEPLQGSFTYTNNDDIRAGVFRDRQRAEEPVHVMKKTIDKQE